MPPETWETTIAAVSAVAVAAISGSATVLAAGARKQARTAARNTTSVSNGAVGRLTATAARTEDAVGRVATDLRHLSGRVDRMQSTIDDVRTVQVDHLAEHLRHSG